MGLIYSQQGVGHFSRGRRRTINLDFSSGRSFSKKMLKQNIPYQVKNMGTERVSQKEINRLFDEHSKIPIQGEFLKVSRLRILFDAPAAIHHAYVSLELFPEVENKIDNNSIFSYYKDQATIDLIAGPSQLSISFPRADEKIWLSCGDLVPLLEFKANSPKNSSYFMRTP